ncbi:integral membrane protein [Stagonosporopsis vannaccii]|nr:integral membrane protein [Stagonosporopsis vannaccii]
MASPTLLGLSLTLTPPALTAIRIAPLLTSTASLTHAYMEWLTNSSFLVAAPVESRLSVLMRGVAQRAVSANAIADAEMGTVIEGEEKQKKHVNADVDVRQKEELEKAKQLVVPEWFTNFFNTGVRSVIGLNTLTLLFAGVNLLLPQGLGASKRFYQLGLVGTVAHYAFVPLVSRSVRALIGLAAAQAGTGEEGEGEGKAVEWVREWVGYHKMRMCSVDLLAWGCFIWGGVHVVTALAKYNGC